MDIKWRLLGTVHDSKLFANSLISMQIPLTFCTLVPRLEKISNCFTRNLAYPVTSYCIKEYDN